MALYTPRWPEEASGTSGMKACLERSPRPSVLDGRWIEGCLEGVTGWAVGQDDDVPRDTSEESALYHKLESIIVPMYYGWPSAFLGDDGTRRFKSTVGSSTPIGCWISTSTTPTAPVNMHRDRQQLAIRGRGERVMPVNPLEGAHHIFIREWWPAAVAVPGVQNQIAHAQYAFQLACLIEDR